jgi:polysaccharide export outer membrane protein
MKLRVIAACLLLLVALSVVPLRASGAMNDSSLNMSGIGLTLPPEDEPAEADSQEQPDAVVESDTGKGTESAQSAPASPPADSAPRREAENTRYAAAPAPADRSWWKGVMHKLGFGADPDPGETVQPAVSNPGVDADYIIGPGDQIGISVWRDENLTRTVVVLPDGKIYFPLIGEVEAGGKTVSQLKEELEKRLSRYVSDTGVTVDVRQSNSMIIYVVGKVNAPGRQILLANTNVLQALAMVGGLNPFADKGDIKIFRQEGGRTVVFNFDYDDVAEGRHLETNIALKRGDVIIVP